MSRRLIDERYLEFMRAHGCTVPSCRGGPRSRAHHVLSRRDGGMLHDKMLRDIMDHAGRNHVRVREIPDRPALDKDETLLRHLAHRFLRGLTTAAESDIIKLLHSSSKFFCSTRTRRTSGGSSLSDQKWTGEKGYEKSGFTPFCPICSP